MNVFYSIWNFLTHAVLGVVLAAQMFFGGFASHTTVSAPTPVMQKHAPSTTNLFPVATSAPKIATSTPTNPKPGEEKSGGYLSLPAGRQGLFAKESLAKPATPTVAIAKTSDQLNTRTRAALVNILCTTKAGGYLNPISGSGVVVDGAGVILTNAHVGQYFLLRDYPTPGNVDCIVRTGSPAQPAYRAELLYLPPVWIAKNANQIIAQEAMGTGENDYAFLLITSSTSGSPLPTAFAQVPITTDTPARGDGVLLASYAAGFLEGSIIQTSLYASSAFTTVAELFSFDAGGSVDVLSVGGTVVSQAGSSGGAVVRRQDGALLGIIATDTQGATTASRDLRAITLGHIDRSLAAQGNGGILQVLSGDLPAKAALFNSIVTPVEKQELVDVLNK